MVVDPKPKFPFPIDAFCKMRFVKFFLIVRASALSVELVLAVLPAGVVGFVGVVLHCVRFVCDGWTHGGLQVLADYLT